MGKEINLKVIVDCNGGTSCDKYGEKINAVAVQLSSLGTTAKHVKLDNSEDLYSYRKILYSEGLNIIACEVPKGVELVI